MNKLARPVVCLTCRCIVDIAGCGLVVHCLCGILNEVVTEVYLLGRSCINLVLYAYQMMEFAACDGAGSDGDQ